MSQKKRRKKPSSIRLAQQSAVTLIIFSNSALKPLPRFHNLWYFLQRFLRRRSSSFLPPSRRLLWGWKRPTDLHFKSELHLSCFCWESPERFNWSGKSTCISQRSIQVILIKVGSLSMIQGLESILIVLCGTHRPSLNEVICKKRTLEMSIAREVFQIPKLLSGCHRYLSINRVPEPEGTRIFCTLTHCALHFSFSQNWGAYVVSR